MLHMTSTTRSDIASDVPVAWNDDGTITITVDGQGPHRFYPLTLDGYADTVDDTIAFAEWLAEVKAANDDERARILALGDSDDWSNLTAVQRAELAKFNSAKRRQDVEMKRKCATMLTACLQRSDPAWTPPDAMPQWFGGVGLVNLILDHWESTPFLGRANGRRVPSTPTGATKSSPEADGPARN